MSCIVVGVESDEIRIQEAEEDLTSNRKNPVSKSAAKTKITS